MRRLAIAAAVLFAPVVAHAQTYPVLQRYALSGCFAGALTVPPNNGGNAVIGTPFCATGSASLAVTDLRQDGTGELYVSGTLNEVFSPAFTGTAVSPSDGNFGVNVGYNGPGCVMAPCETGGVLHFAPGSSSGLNFYSYVPYSLVGADLATARVLPLGLTFQYRLPGIREDQLSYAQGEVTFTATPEPATLDLMLGGIGTLAVVGAGARRRQQA